MSIVVGQIRKWRDSNSVYRVDSMCFNTVTLEFIYSTSNADQGNIGNKYDVSLVNLESNTFLLSDEEYLAMLLEQ